MPTFKILLTRTVTEECEVDVDAQDEVEAIDKAYESLDRRTVWSRVEGSPEAAILAPVEIVHHLHAGHTTCCGMSLLHGTPDRWPEGHKWSAERDEVTCPVTAAGGPGGRPDYKTVPGCGW